MDPRLVSLRHQYQPPTRGDSAAPVFNRPVTLIHRTLRRAGDDARGERAYVVDTLFPQSIAGLTDTAGVDEGTADLLYGLIRSLQPKVVLETGTHKGRSTRAIATALRSNGEIDMVEGSYTAFTPLKGAQLYTIDAENHQIFTSGALPVDTKPYVTQIIGWTPEVFEEPPLRDLTGIEFAFLDGDHTPEGLAAELDYVDAHRAEECWIAVDNSRDSGWPELRRYLHSYHKYPRVSLGTCTGLDLIWMKG